MNRYHFDNKLRYCNTPYYYGGQPIPYYGPDYYGGVDNNNNNTTSLSSLPIDHLIEVVAKLSVKELTNLCQVDRSLYATCHNQIFWNKLFDLYFNFTSRSQKWLNQ